MININLLRKKTLPLLAAILVTAIFSLRYINCLPFSGKMPIVSYEGSTRLGSYMIYARESFSFPLGLIKGLTFPYHDADVLIAGSIPLFAIFFKSLSKLYTPLSTVYYFVLVDLLAVFFMAYLAYLLLEKMRVEYFLSKLLGSILCGLSFALLAKSHCDQPLTVIHFPIYMAFMYYYIKLAEKPSLRCSFAFLSVFIIAALADPYVLFGISVMASFCILVHFLDFLFTKDDIKGKKFIFILIALIFGVFLSFVLICVLDLIFKRQTIKNKKQIFILTTLILGILLSFPIIFITSTNTGSTLMPEITCIGFGFGGGYHVADVFSLIIPPGEIYPGNLYPVKIGHFINTDNLEKGQFSGFVYLGATTIGLIISLLIANLISVLHNIKSYFVKLQLKIASRFYAANFFSPFTIIGIAALMAYIFSLGYVIHVFGFKLNSIIFTPSGILAELWHRLFEIRTLGRLAFPFSLYVIIWTIVSLDRYLNRHRVCSGSIKKIFCAVFVIFLIISHIYEIKGYLKPLEATPNIIMNVFSKEEVSAIKKLLQSKRALFLVPNIAVTHAPQYIRSVEYSKTWDKICYSLAFYSGIPINSEDGARVNLQHSVAMQSDASSILNGDIKTITNKHGNIAIASPYKIAKEILERTNVPLSCYKIQNVGILILKE